MKLLWQKIGAHPDLLSLHLARPDRYPFLLESTSRGHGSGPHHGRYDILFAFPQERLMLESSGRLSFDGREIPGGDFLDELDARFAKEEMANQAAPPGVPFRGGWFLYLGYELAGQIEPVLRARIEENIRRNPHSVAARFPMAVAWRVPAAIIRDRYRGETILVTEPHSAGRLMDLEQDARRAAMAFHDDAMVLPAPILSGPMEEDPTDEFLGRIASIERYIREGDVFQVNLSRGWQSCLRTGVTSAQLYHKLRQRNPGAFAGLAAWDDLAIISSSPERLVRVENGVIETRPIAGTHPRDPDRQRDHDLSRALLSHPKERAEHIMLIDLERNDLGRVCRTGSVRVDELMVLESYAHVHHIVSNVRGNLLPHATPGEVLRAVFPGGTITGCPKVRCMEIIAELEQTPRGPYTGAMGYLNRDGDMDLNILIRTLCRHGDRIGLRAGSGIVADSKPQRELEETRHKACGPLGSLLGGCRAK